MVAFNYEGNEPQGNPFEQMFGSPMSKEAREKLTLIKNIGSLALDIYAKVITEPVKRIA